MATIARLSKQTAVCVLCCWAFTTTAEATAEITIESLLDEMVSYRQASELPYPEYRCLQISSHDRRSMTPDAPGWFANNDGFGCERIDTVDGRVERVMFDEKGPAAITRIWITSTDKRGVWRFYFDGEKNPSFIIPGYDLTKTGIEGLGNGLIHKHTHYEPASEGRGGNTSYLPIPFAKSCKITFEEPEGAQPSPKYYHINFRKYPDDVKVETFSKETATRAAQKIRATDNALLNPHADGNGKQLAEDITLSGKSSREIKLPDGENAVYELSFDIHTGDTQNYSQTMRKIVLTGIFDGKKTIEAPLSDFSGGGAGAPEVDSWYLTSDGKGKITSRWRMPYRKNASLKITNISGNDVRISVTAGVESSRWTTRSLYFHASWKKQDSIYIHNNPDEFKKCGEWNFATIKGKGVYMGDLLSLYNYSPAWYGEGDEKIYVDGEKFPSHFGTYNCSWAPVVPFHTPFGGAPRADTESSHGYNAFLRTRNTDGIPFNDEFRFDIEMIGWNKGYVDYTTTIFWYGDFDATAVGITGIDGM